MGELSSPSSLADAATDAEPLVCPNCGYDLRAVAAERCSECGYAIDQAELRTSGFPWAHRSARGRVRAYLRTVWLVTAGSRRIAHEASRPQKLPDARAFRRVTATLVGLALLSAFALLVVLDGGSLGFLAVPPADSSAMDPSERWIQDVIIPWCAGATLWPVIPIVLIGWSVYVTGVQRRLFRVRDLSEAQEERAEAVALYAIAPMAFALPAVLWAVLVATLVGTGVVRERQAGALLVPTWLLWGSAILLSMLRIVQWSVRARRQGLERVVIDVPHLVGLWLFGIFVYFFFLPWGVGFLWLIVDSLLG